MRASILLKTEEVHLIVDTPPDFRTQCLREDIRRVDAVLYTHTHTDHIMGFDDLRRFCEMSDSDLPVYGVPQTLTDLKRIFGYAFDGSHSFLKNYMRALPREILGEFVLGDLRIVPVPLPHGKFTTIGFVFYQGKRKVLAYYTDCGEVPPAAADAARGAEVLVLDALRHVPHPTHLTVEAALEVAQHVEVATCYFTHMSHDLKHKDTEASLPPGILLAYDGLRVRI